VKKIAILIPCYNEAIAIAGVVRDFRQAIPEAEIHVFDNNSSDDTSAIARAAGATVHFVPTQGKGAVVREMFRVIDCDVCVMVDGDNTYPADQVRALLQPVLEGRADMVVGTRLQQSTRVAINQSFVWVKADGCAVGLSCVFGTLYEDNADPVGWL
jgi:glycosyltransferase involved in cell wall biosynthesis